ncbi:MAG: Hsp20/alpha crystallin family protein [Pseudomonadota bacterium]|nr:Hsp20/alpha crystallin family protein [Pseudomonadota bacterium]
MFHPLTLFSRNRQVQAQRDQTHADPFYRLHYEVNRLFDDAFAGLGAPFGFTAPGVFSDARPRIDVHETDTALEIEAELPGVSEDDLNVEIANNTLTIRGEKRNEKRDERGGDYHYIERSYGSFARSIPLPYEVDPDAVEAVFKNGVLKMTLPKPADAARASRRIAIKRG